VLLSSTQSFVEFGRSDDNMKKIRAELRRLSKGNEEYAVFGKKIINTQKTVLGVRTPDFRKLSKSLAKEINTYKQIEDLFKQIDKNVYEEVSVVGVLIVDSKLSDDEKIELMKKYLQLVDNWAQIDGMVSADMNSDEWWRFAVECLKSDKEFVVRFGVMVMMKCFIHGPKLNDVFKLTQAIKNDKYYIKMGIAWLYAETAVKQYKQTLAEVVKLEPWTQRKALTKMTESFRFTPEQKTEIRELRDKIKE